MSGEQNKLLREIKNFLRELIHSEFRIKKEVILDEISFEDLGIESMQAIQIVNKLEDKFQGLPKTLLFDYSNLEELSLYFLEEYSSFFGFSVDKISNKKPESQAFISAKQDSGMKENLLPPASPHLKPLAKEFKSIKEELDDDIAIIGMSGRFPKASTANQLWEVLKGGKDCISEIPADRWDYRQFYDPNRSMDGKCCSKWGGFLEDVDAFDPLFFKIAKDDADVMDPQERLFLQETWYALEDAGYTPKILRDSIKGEVGVYVGTMYLEYPLHNPASLLSKDKRALNTSASSIANRISYFFDLSGPSLAIDTMCSSSLTTLYFACKALREGECKVAISGGVNLSLHPHKYIMLGRENFLSSEGKCKSFGEGGDGYVPSEGVGVFVLKPLKEAIKSGDHIYGIVKGIGINHGAKASGFTVPNSKAQARLIQRVVSQAGISVEHIDYVEAHGTGTSLGDPMELEGLTRAFKALGLKNEGAKKIPIGSIKSNIGHCEAAAGAAGLTKVLLQIQHRELVPSIHSANLSSNIDWSKVPFVVQQSHEPWDSDASLPLTSLVSAFGAGGSNAVAIIQEYKKNLVLEKEKTNEIPLVFVLSALSDERLLHYLAIYKEFLLKAGDIDLIDFLYTLQVRRNHFPTRISIVFESLEDLIHKIDLFLAHNTNERNIYFNNASKIKNFFKSVESPKDFEELLLNRERKESKNLGWIAELWSLGIDINWNEYYENLDPQVMPLPKYPFNKTRCWFNRQSEANLPTRDKLYPLVHRNQSSFGSQSYSSTFQGTEFFLKDHVIDHECLMPGAALVEMFLEASSDAMKKTPQAIHDLSWLQPIELKNNPKSININLGLETSDTVSCSASSLEEGLYSKAKVSFRQHTPSKDSVSVESIKQRCESSIDRDVFYKNFQDLGFMYGPSFQVIQSVQYNDDEFLAKVAIERKNEFSFVNPILLDAMFQASSVCGSKQNLALPFLLDSITFQKNELQTGYIYGCLRKGKNLNITIYDICFVDSNGRVFIDIQGFKIKELNDSQQVEKIPQKNTFQDDLDSELSVDAALALLK